MVSERISNDIFLKINYFIFLMYKYQKLFLKIINILF